MKFLRRLADKPTALDQGLKILNERMGNSPTRVRRRPARTRVVPTRDISRSIFYAPDMDGQAEPGEVVWFNVPTTPLKERSMLVVGRDRHEVLGLLISANEDHADDSDWVAIGCGEWKATGEPCWVRMDKTLFVPETDLRRRGALFPARRFEHIADHLRKHFDWA
ncbi:type II toxin-antitoxin system PemK/MazF family toxin [Corynebacterium appendicis]|uniref:type II toxin-antitoxin system PemK/MazF family toxin n=1 Tax=Corynebacterium appendicis TaxID=163202 RepID=UPI0021AF944E|nr:type II toxin-antitoxin system PemK/MazF family toxin [Corynebacterium appendicis]MCT1683336.1 type II toxin-antitoxin system PemK/MazF family toxin [Corynebacterium appendicis]